MIAKMKKLTLACVRSDADTLSKELVWLEAVETSELDKDNLPEGLTEFDNASELYKKEQELSLLKDAIDTLSPYGKSKTKPWEHVYSKDEFEALSDTHGKALALAEETSSLTREIASIASSVNRIDSDIASLSPFVNFDEPISLESTRSTAIIKGTFPKTAKLDAIRGALDEKGFDFEIGELSQTGDYIYVYAVVLKEQADEFSSAMGAEGFSRIIISGFDKSARKEIALLNQKKDELLKETERKKEKYADLAKDRGKIEAAYDWLSSRIEIEHVKQKLYSTESACVLTGWVPESKIPILEKKLGEFECCYEFEDPSDDEKVPVKLVNKKLVTPFESVLGLYSYPDYRGIDPTFVMSIFYFIIFGLIMQDVLYGALLCFGCAGLIKILHTKKGTSMYKLLRTFSICGVSTMIFGFLFGGYFGDLPSAIATNMFGVTDFPDLAIVFNPVENPMPYLVISLALGAVHLIAGMLMKAYMLIREGKVLDAIFDIGLWLVLFAGIGLLFAVPDVGKWVAIAGAAGLILTQGRAEKNIIMKLLKGIMSLYDIVSYISDLLSYSRIMALGLSGAIIAQVVNIIGTLGGPTVVGFIVLILAMVLGHALNLALNLLGAFVHTARLQYIEFFNKFYIDGGDEFKPSKIKTKYTEIIEEAK